MHECCEANRIWIGHEIHNWNDLFEAAVRKISNCNAEMEFPVAHIVDSPRSALEWVVLGAKRGLDLAIIGKDRLTEGVLDTITKAGLTLDTGTYKRNFEKAQGRVWILTSGSTGSPKLIQHTWDSLLTIKKNPSPYRWLLPYQIGTYAWYQLVIPSLFLEGQELAIPPYGSDVASILRYGKACDTDAISSTPTFWRVALLSMSREELLDMRWNQITLGGEIVDQVILDELRNLFPAARITHIYAATEVGACIFVNDGNEGFSASLLEDETRTIRLMERAGTLWVRSPNSAKNKEISNAEGWINTGDMIERYGDRFLFKGRIGRQLINIGGQKAYPSDVEAVLLNHPAVQWCRVYARKAPLVGNLVSADIVPVPGISKISLESEIIQYCHKRLPEYAIPRFIKFIDNIPLGGNMKSIL